MFIKSAFHDLTAKKVMRILEENKQDVTGVLNAARWSPQVEGKSEELNDKLHQILVGERKRAAQKALSGVVYHAYGEDKLGIERRTDIAKAHLFSPDVMFKRDEATKVCYLIWKNYADVFDGNAGIFLMYAGGYSDDIIY